MINLENVNKLYRTDRVETMALENINLDVAEGEFVSIMGPSGCGKSTLLNLMGLLDTPSVGGWQLNGEEVQKQGERKLARLRNEKIGFVFQTFHLIPDLTRPRQRRDAASLSPDAGRAAAEDGPAPRSTVSVSPHASTTSRRSSPEASSSGSRSPAPSSGSRGSSSPTSRRETSTARWGTRSWRSSRSSTGTIRRPSSWSRTTSGSPADASDRSPLRRSPGSVRTGQ